MSVVNETWRGRVVDRTSVGLSRATRRARVGVQRLAKDLVACRRGSESSAGSCEVVGSRLGDN